MGQRRVRGDRRRARDRAAGFLDPRRPAADHPPAPHGAARDELPLQYKTATRAVPDAGDVLPPQHKTAIRAAQAPGTTCRHGTRLPPSPQACRDQAKRRASTEGRPRTGQERAGPATQPGHPRHPPASRQSMRRSRPSRPAAVLGTGPTRRPRAAQHHRPQERTRRPRRDLCGAGRRPSRPAPLRIYDCFAIMQINITQR